MDREKIVAPIEYRNKKSSFVKGAVGPGFVARFQFHFEEPKTVEEVLEFLHVKGVDEKIVMIFIEEEHAKLTFIYQKFSSYSKIPPGYEIDDGKKVDQKSGTKKE